MLHPRRWIAALVGGGMLAWSLVLALAGPPQTDAGKKERVETMYAGFRGMFSEVPEVDVAALKAQLDDPNLVLVDVREPAEQAVSMLPGAITAAQFEADPKAYAGKEIVAYCTIGYRSGLWAKAQRAQGVDARNLVGSLLSWTHAGGSLVHDGAPTQRVHVYGSRWNLAASGYIPTW